MEKNQELRLNDFIEVDVFQPNHGKYPIGRHNGRICKLEFVNDIKFVEYGATVLCEVMIINPKCLNVLVHEIVRSKYENDKLAEQAISKLSESIKAKKGVKHSSPVKKGHTINLRW